MESVWDLAGALLRYPDERYLEALDACRRGMRAVVPEAGTQLDRFHGALAGLSPEARQELFVATFDLNPACTLEVGWHLFGENYERGAFLVKMRQLLARIGVSDDGELPDHLGTVLRALGRMPADEAAEFTDACLLPALAKMRTHLVGKSNPFESLLEAIARLVTAMHGQPCGDGVTESAGVPADNGRGVQ